MQALDGKRVAIVGAGRRAFRPPITCVSLGHACTLFDENPSPGGRLLSETTEGQLPRDVLRAEIAAITRLGVEVKTGESIGPDAEFAALRTGFDAVLLACGPRHASKREAGAFPSGNAASS